MRRHASKSGPPLWNLLRPITKVLCLLVPYGYITIEIKKKNPKETTAVGSPQVMNSHFGAGRARVKAWKPAWPMRWAGPKLQRSSKIL